MGGGSQGQERFFSYRELGCSRDWFFSHFFQHIPGQWRSTECFVFLCVLTELVFFHFFQYIPGEWRSTGCFVFPPSHLQQTQSYEEVGFSPQVYQGTFPTRKCTQPRPQQGHFISPELEGLFRLLTWLNLSKFQTFIKGEIRRTKMMPVTFPSI